MAHHDPKSTAFVFVGGVSHTPIFFSVVIEELTSRGYVSHAFAYPTIGAENEGKTQQDEYHAIQSAVSQFADHPQHPKDVVLVGHSYGGWTISRAVKGWDKESRKRQGKDHGIKELCFVSAFCPPEGADMKTYSYLPPWITVRDGDGRLTGERKPNEAAIPLLFNDLPEDKQRYWFEQLAWQRNAFQGETIDNAPWHLKTLPKTYILTTRDAGAPLSFQLGTLKEVIDESWAVRSIASGHEPMLSKPRELVDTILAPRY